MTETVKPRREGLRTMNRINGAMAATNGSPFAAMTAFMGLPFFARSGASDSTGHGSAAGFGGMLYPQNNYGGPNSPPGGGGGGGGNNPGTGGDGPGTGDPNTDAMLKVGLPRWWVDWLHTSGQYGVWNQPPQGGLLD